VYIGTVIAYSYGGCAEGQSQIEGENWMAIKKAKKSVKRMKKSKKLTSLKPLSADTFFKR
jgi:hypothetical protein